MRCYRVRLEGPVEALISLRAGPVRRRPALGAGAGEAAVAVRYALAPGGEVRVHRGVLLTDLPVGTRLRATAWQVDGCDLLLSLAPIRPARGCTPARWDDRFSLPFQLQSWGVTAIRHASVRLRVACRARPGAMLLRGALCLTLTSPAARFRLQIPFARLVAAELPEGLEWRGLGGVVALGWQVGPGGAVAGEVTLAVACRGRQPAGEPAPAPAVALVRKVDARVAEARGECLASGRALLQGRVELEVDWADRSGRSRWSGRELPFSALANLAGLEEGDALAVEGQVDRVIRTGDRAVILLSLAMTALRTGLVCLENRTYRMEQVVAQGVATLSIEAELFPAEPDPPAPPALTAPPVAVGLPGSPPDGWDAMRLRLTGRGLSAGGARLPLPGQPGAWRLESVGTDEAVVRRLPLEQWPEDRGVAGGVRSEAAADLSGALAAIGGLSLTGGACWEACLLARVDRRWRLLTLPLDAPAGHMPHSATVFGVGQDPVWPRRLQIVTDWQPPE